MSLDQIVKYFFHSTLTQCPAFSLAMFYQFIKYVMARSPDDPQRSRVASVFEFSVRLSVSLLCFFLFSILICSSLLLSFGILLPWKYSAGVHKNQKFGRGGEGKINSIFNILGKMNSIFGKNRNFIV